MADHPTLRGWRFDGALLELLPTRHRVQLHVWHIGELLPMRAGFIVIALAATILVLGGCAEPPPSKPDKGASEPTGRTQEKDSTGDEKR